MRLHTIRHGGGPAEFVLVHGLASNARMWDGVGAELAARGHGSLAVDLRGHGRSPKPDDGYDHGSVLGDLLPLLVDRPVVAGQSYGGNLVVELAARHPDLVRAIACVDGGAIEPHRWFPTWESCREAMAPPPLAGTPFADIEAWARKMHADWPDSGIAGALANFEVLDDGTVRPWLTLERHLQILRAMWEARPSSLFPGLAVPVLFLVASDRMRPAVEAAVDAAPDARVLWFDDAHHDLHAQRPVEVADALVALL